MYLCCCLGVYTTTVPQKSMQMHGLRQKVIILIPSCSPYSISWSHTAWYQKSGNDWDWKVHGCLAKWQDGLQQSTTPKMLLWGLTAKHLLPDSCTQRQLNTKLLLTSKLTSATWYMIFRKPLPEICWTLEFTEINVFQFGLSFLVVSEAHFILDVVFKTFGVAS